MKRHEQINTGSARFVECPNCQHEVYVVLNATATILANVSEENDVELHDLEQERRELRTLRTRTEYSDED